MENTIKEKVERSFSAEVSQLLGIVARSLYLKEEIFMRELVSNASDALEKLRFLSLENSALIDEPYEAYIAVTFDKEENWLCIEDNGVGMSRDDLVQNLGTIAQSGTKRFLDSVASSTEAESSNSETTSSLIGQFGVGFYSSFMVADRVLVCSKKVGSDEAWYWESDGKGKFVTYPAEDPSEIKQGTRITLFLKEEAAQEYLDKFRLEHIIKKYSDHLSIPIKMSGENGQLEQVNSGVALWKKDKSEITPEQHQDFFRSILHVGGEPWLTLHNKQEGMIEYTNLLYIPSIRPYDLFHPDRKCKIQLYSRGSFITEDNDLSLHFPKYLRFIAGVVDSSDLPLNISREALQSNPKITRIRDSLIKKITSKLKDVLENDRNKYLGFWKNFGSVLKEGLSEATESQTRDTLFELSLFHSTKSLDTPITLAEYIGRMDENQDYIYYFNGSSLDAMYNSPQVEGFIKKDIEVLLLTDPSDDFWTTIVYEHQKKKFKSVTHANIDLEKANNSSSEEKDKDAASEEEKPQVEESVQNFLDYLKKVLGEAAAEIRISKRLTSSPVCLAVPEGSFGMHMERFLIEQKQLHQRSAKILEVNLEHSLMKKLQQKFSTEGDTEDLQDHVRLLFDIACITEEEPISDTIAHNKRSLKLLEKSLS